MAENEDKNNKMESDKNKLTTGSDYLNRMTPEEFLQWMNNVELQLYLGSRPEVLEQKKRFVLYRDDIQKRIKEFNTDYAAIYGYLLSENARVDEERFHAKIGKKPDEEKILQKITSEVLEPYIEYYKEAADKFEISATKKSNVELSNYNIIDVETKSPEALDEEITLQLPDNFSQITYSNPITKEELLSDFMLLNNSINPKTRKPFMEVAAIKGLLKKNFEIFKSKPNGNYFEISLEQDQKYIMWNFMYQIYKKYERFPLNNKMKYAYFLKYNFELFMKDTPNSIETNMRKKSSGRFSIKVLERK